jgi:hypothetical protein
LTGETGGSIFEGGSVAHGYSIKHLKEHIDDAEHYLQAKRNAIPKATAQSLHACMKMRGGR